MRIVEILKSININLDIDSFFKVNDELINVEFEYYQLKNTCFEFDYNRKSILHFTNIESARLILENGYLKGSNFNNFNDDFEITKVLSLLNDKILSDWTKIKARTFAVSFTEKTLDEVQKNYKYHWLKFGNQNKGVAFEFEFAVPSLRDGFYPLRIYYLDKDSPYIKIISNKLPGSLILSEVEKEFLLPILASIKDKEKYKNENEVRLMYKLSAPEIEHLDNSLDSSVFFSFTKDNSLSLELRVPYSTISNISEKNILKLKRIYLGKSFINSEDNTSSSLALSYFERLCEIRGVQLIY